jgi:xanthine dehydrogenase YagS FAD-binding subunit
MRLEIATDRADLSGEATFMAGGTDLGERLRSGTAVGPIVDITRLPGLSAVEADESGVSIGALVTLAAVADHPLVKARHAGLAEVCSTIATSQIRSRATMGGVLCQRTRCWYFRNPGFDCFKSGGDRCHARDGNNLYGVAFDRGPCAFPHPSSVALALMVHDACIDTTSRSSMPIQDLFGDGSDPSRDHHLETGELLTHVRVPDPEPNENTAYVRMMSRAQAEWPWVECVARIRWDGGAVSMARVALGGVANIPLRLPQVEEALIGTVQAPGALPAIAELAKEGARVTPGGPDKRPMIVGTVLETLERVLRR